MASSRSKKSIYDEGRLYTKRGLCPNRNELLMKLFKITEKTKKWTISFVYLQETTEISELTKLNFLYISDSKKIFFLPNHHEFAEDRDVHGYFLTIQRSEQDSCELIKEKLKLYYITPADIMKYMPRLSPALIEELTKHHKISINSERLKRAKLDKLIEFKREKGEEVYFYSEGYSRLDYQTTGSVYGHWTTED